MPENSCALEAKLALWDEVACCYSPRVRKTSSFSGWAGEPPCRRKPSPPHGMKWHVGALFESGRPRLFLAGQESIHVGELLRVGSRARLVG